MIKTNKVIFISGCFVVAVLLSVGVYDFGTQRGRALLVYDVFCKLIENQYYDRKLTGLDWGTVRADGRLKAKVAKNETELYSKVLWPITQKFPVSHVNVSAPQTFRVRVLDNKSTNNSDKIQDQSDIGFELDRIQYSPWTTVGDVTPGSEAARAGITPGWTVVQASINIGDRGIGTFDGVFRALDGRQYHISYEFGASSENNKQKNFYSNGICISRFDEFNGAAMEKMLPFIERCRSKLVIDLRRNVGGEMSALQAFSNALFSRRVVIGQIIFRDRKVITESKPLNTSRAAKLAILIGPTTASAAEIIADAVKENNLGVLIGRRTNGSVMAAKSFSLPDGGKVQIPIAEYLSPLGHKIEGVGVAPDIEVIPTLSDVKAGRDAAMDKAISLLK